MTPSRPRHRKAGSWPSELPRWREYKALGALLSARISGVAFGTDDRNDVAKYVIAAKVPTMLLHTRLR
jgi:hypothetical protein